MTSVLAKTAFAALTSIAVLSANASAAESVYTATSGKTCTKPKLEDAHFGVMRCKGPGRFSFLTIDDGNSVGMEFGLPGKEGVVSGMQWRGVGKVIGDRIEWRTAHGEAYAAIVRNLHD